MQIPGKAHPSHQGPVISSAWSSQASSCSGLKHGPDHSWRLSKHLNIYQGIKPTLQTGTQRPIHPGPQFIFLNLRPLRFIFPHCAKLKDFAPRLPNNVSSVKDNFCPFLLKSISQGCCEDLMRCHMQDDRACCLTHNKSSVNMFSFFLQRQTTILLSLYMAYVPHWLQVPYSPWGQDVNLFYLYILYGIWNYELSSGQSIKMSWVNEWMLSFV